MSYPKEIQEKAIDVAFGIGPKTPWEPIADALLAEREANAAEVNHWRDLWRVASFSLDADACVGEDCRSYAKQIIGCNATFVDDDLRVLAHLADLAVAAGLTKGLNSVCRESIERLHAERRKPCDNSEPTL